MKKVFKFVKGKKDEKKESGGITPSQSGDLISPAQTPEDERFLGLDNTSGYVVDFNGKDKTLTKLHKTAWQGNLEKLKSALKKVEIDAVDKHNRTALHFAVAQGHPNIVWFLIGNNANTSICDDEGYTPLLKAIECGHKECLKLLLDRGTDINAADYTGNTGLHIAVKQGSADTVSTLLSKGVNTEVSNNGGDYPLHIATKSENKDLVDLLMNAGAEVNVLDRENRTPLMLAAKAGNMCLVNLFFECGAQLTMVDSNGWTAEDYALLAGHENVASTLKDLGKSKYEKSEESENDSQKESEVLNVTNLNDCAESWADSQSDASERNDQVNKKLKDIFKSCSKDEADIAIGKEKEEENLDSPNGEEKIPPFCQPPRSWEMIQAGMIDGNTSRSEPKRLSLTTLGTLHSRRESFTEGLSITSPKYTLSLNRRRSAKIDNSFAKQRLSFNEEISLKSWLSEEASNRSSAKDDEVKDSATQEPIKSQSLKTTVSTSESDWDKDSCCNSSEAKASVIESNSMNLNNDLENSEKNETLGRKDKTAEGVDDEICVENLHLSPIEPDKDEEGKSNSWDSEPSANAKEINFPPPPSALELGADMAKSLKYIKGISEDHSSGNVVEKNLWKNAYETHSLDRLEEKNIPEDSKVPPFKGHFRQQSTSSLRWKSQEIPKCQKPTDRLIDVNRRINEQLECYDQALRELAESCTTKTALTLTSEKVSSSSNYYSLPSSKIRSFNGERTFDSKESGYREKFLSSGPFSAPVDLNEMLVKKSDSNTQLKVEDLKTEPSSDDELSGKNSDKTEEEVANKSNEGSNRKAKRQILMAMREVKHTVNVSNAFRTSLDDQILSPLTKPEDSFELEDGSTPKDLSESYEKASPPDEDSFFALGRQQTVLERKSSSETGEEPTLWLQNNAKRTDDDPNAAIDDGSDEDVSEISEERFQKRTYAFSPLGIIHQEIQNEIQNSSKTGNGISPNKPNGLETTEENRKKENLFLHSSFLGTFNDENDELKEIVRDQSPDISLSSGPIEPLGTEKDSGSEPESSHNDVTPTHHYSLKTQQEWLKYHLKTATSEKSKLEEIAAQLLEKAERLQYELADAKEATKSRDEVIKLLQEQLARMETAYTKSLEESVQSRLQLTSHEQEILHLKEICYKYEEEKTKEVRESEGENFEKLESRIKKLEGEKEKMREEIVLLESEKTSLVKRLKELTKPEVIDQCQRWKERCEKEVEKARDDTPDETACKSEKGRDREKQLEERNLYLERKVLEMTEENAELNSKFQKVMGQIESEKKINDSVSELKKKNFELEAYVKCLEREMEEKKMKNFNEKEKEMEFLMKQFSRERESLIKIYKKKLNEKNSEDFHVEKWKRENERLKEMIKSLQDQISIMENKYSAENSKESLKSELFELKDQCDFVSKSVDELKAKDQQDLDYLVKENADLKKAITEIKISLSRDDGYAADCKEKYMELASENAKMKNIISDLESQVNSLTLLLNRSDKMATDPNLKNGSLERREKQRSDDGSDRKGSQKKNVGAEDHLAWSNLYGIKSSEKPRNARSSLSESSVKLWRVDGEEESREIEGKEKNGVDSSNVETDRNHSYDKLELLRLKKEIAFLQSKMLDEKALRKCLENQIEEISRDLREKQTLENEVLSLKRKINRDYVQKSDLDLVQYNKDLQEKREKYLDVATVDVATNSDYKAKCEILAKEREKSKEIRSKIWNKTRSFHGKNRASRSPVSRLGFSSSVSPTGSDTFVSPQYGTSGYLTLQPEIKNQLEKELEKSIRKYKSESSALSTSTAQMELLK